MPNDIRLYFKVQPSSSKTKPSPKKPKIIEIDSNDEDVIESTPVKKKVFHKSSSKRKIHILSDSDSDKEQQKKSENPKALQKQSKPNLKKVNVEDVFGNNPIKQTEVKLLPQVKNNDIKTVNQTSKSKRKKLKTELGIHNDEKFEQSLLELDEDVLLQNVDELDKSIKLELNSSREESLNETVSKKSHGSNSQKRKFSPTKSEKKHSENTESPSKKQKVEDYLLKLELEQLQKRVQSAQSYQKYLQREGPPNQGNKDLPIGSKTCLKDLTFLRTGVLDSLDGTDFQKIIEDHGGRVVHAVSKKINYVVVGEDPGPAKIEKVHKYNIPTISEDELLDIIRIKSGMDLFYTTGDSKIIKDLIAITPKNTRDVLQIETKNKELPMQKNKNASPAKDRSSKPDLENVSSKTPKKSIPKSPNKPQKSPKIDLVKSPEKPQNHLTESFSEKSTEKCNDNDVDTHPQDLKLECSCLALTEKYKPQTIKNIIGQQGDNSNLKKLLNWLQHWHYYHINNNKEKKSKAGFSGKNDFGVNYKAALLSGTPGIGKTTTATLVAKECGFDIVEFNASDTRSKKLLHVQVSQLLSSKTIASFAKDGSQPSTKRVLLMDEVDGMAGNEDRGGMQELISLIKNTSVPIICMCNDRNHPKVRSLSNYCYDLRFQRPRLEQIRSFLMTVCCREQFKVPPNALSEIISGAGMDIRQCLNNLAMWVTAEKNLSVETAKKEATLASKDIILGPWEVCRKIFTKKEHENMSLTERGRLFFYDYSLSPLFVQENYLQVVPHSPRNEFISRAAKTADSLSFADTLDKRIRSTNNWSLLEVESMFISVIPGTYMGGHIGGQINFPSWLGKNSKKNKFQRILTDIQAHMRTSTSASRLAVGLDYLPHLKNKILLPLVEKGMDGINEAIETMKTYKLTRDDLDGIIELSQWKNSKDLSKQLNSKVKAAFTRAFNKCSSLPYASGNNKKRANVFQDFVNDNEEENNDSDSEVEVKKIAKTKPKAKKSKEEKPSTSGKKGGKGKKKPSGK